jgi:hypothetical protein
VTDDVDNNGQTGFTLQSVALETGPVLLEVHSEALEDHLVAAEPWRPMAGTVTEENNEYLLPLVTQP